MQQAHRASELTQHIPLQNASLSVDAGNCRSQADLIRTLFSGFHENGIRYCVLHSWDGLPDSTIASDLDLAVDATDIKKLGFVFRVLGKRGYQVVQYIEYEVNACCFIIVWPEGVHLRSLAVDIISEQWVNGIVMPDQASILTGRRLYHDFWVASAELEFAYLLAKRASKGIVDSKQAERLHLLAKEIGRAEVLRTAKQLALGARATHLLSACMAGDFRQIGTIKKTMWLAGLLRHPFLFCRHAFRNLARLAGRWRKPTGLVIAVMGPDGVGKSALLDNLSFELQDVFRGINRFHWRPSIVRHRQQMASEWSQPQKARGEIASLAVLMGVILDNWVGYFGAIREAIARSRLILFDRCYWDLLVDPGRYRYGGSIRLARWLSRLVPRPDLFIVLDAPQEVVFRRKQEKSVRDLKGQREQYTHLAEDEDRAFLIDANRPAELVCFSCVETILTFLIARFHRRYQQWLYNAEI